eukprot:6527217-Lingulodinium_polyedra.AAC.1
MDNDPVLYDELIAFAFPRLQRSSGVCDHSRTPRRSPSQLPTAFAPITSPSTAACGGRWSPSWATLGTTR